MINRWMVTGDTHGQVVERLRSVELNSADEKIGFIILGDAGINFYLNKTDRKNKEAISACENFIVYCVRGNHEERPQNIEGMLEDYDDEVDGYVCYEPDFPNIRYFLDGGIYNINGHSVLVIGGAYSVDKWYRLARFNPGATWTGWFPTEQLTAEEMYDIETLMTDSHFDFILTHTCPESWQPFDMFISGLDQSTVDKSMEVWFDGLKDKINWKIWLFGHFHDDRLVRPGVEMLFQNVWDLEDIYTRWTTDDEPFIGFKKDPYFYF